MLGNKCSGRTRAHHQLCLCVRYTTSFGVTTFVFSLVDNMGEEVRMRIGSVMSIWQAVDSRIVVSKGFSLAGGRGGAVFQICARF